MNTPAGVRVSLRDVWVLFLKHQWARFVFRLQILRYTIVPLAFWTILLSGTAQLESRGLSWLGALIVLVWLIPMLPGLVVQAMLVGDAAQYALSRRVIFFHIFAEPADGTKHPPVRDTWFTKLAQIAAHTSPFNGLALWSYGVLVRAHSKEFAPAASPAAAKPKAATPPLLAEAERKTPPRRNRRVYRQGARAWRFAQRGYFEHLGSGAPSNMVSV